MNRARRAGPHRTLVTCFAVAGALALVVGPTGSAFADDLDASYDADVEFVIDDVEESASTTVTLSCTGDVCDVASGLFDIGITVDFADGGGEGEGVIYPAEGDPCVPESYDSGWAMSVSYAAGTLTTGAGATYENVLRIHYRSAEGGSFDCPIENGIQWYTYDKTSYSVYAVLDDPCPAFASCPIAEQPQGEPVVDDAAFPGEPFHAIGGVPLGSVSQVADRPADGAAPSVLAALPTIQSATILQPQLFAAIIFGLIAAGITAFVAFASPPVGQYTQELVGKLPWTKGVGKRLRAVRDGIATVTRRALSGPPIVAWAVIAGVYLVAIMLSVLLDPGAGLNAGTARMALSLLVVFAIQSVVGWLVLRVVLTRAGEPVEFRPHVSPGVIVLILAAVLVSRLLGFEPGIVFGALLGLTFGATLAGARKAKATMIGSGILIGLSLASWVAYSIAVAAGLDRAGFAGVFALETLSALVVAGASGLAVALLPHKAFEGQSVWVWNRAIWALLYAGGAFYALVVLGLLPYDPTTITAPFLGWLLLYLAIGIVALVLWLLARRAARASVPVVVAEPSSP